MGALTEKVSGLFSRGSVAAGEVRTGHPSNHEGWDWWGPSTAAGLAAPSVEGSLALPAVFACVRVLSETIASLPLNVYRRTAGGGRGKALEHPLFELLHNAPNPEQTSFEFRELVVSHAAAWGNGFAEIEWTQGGRVKALWPLRPDRMQWKRRNGEVFYLYTKSNGGQEELRWWQVMHVRGLGGDGMMGYSPVRMAMVAVSLGLATEEYGARFFANGARPGFVLTHPGVLGDKGQERLKKNWSSEHQGVANAHKVRILEEGMKAERLGVPPEEAQFLETRNFQAQEIARMFRMPPHKIGLLDKATFSNIEHQAIEFVVDTIRPWLVRLEQAMMRDLLTKTERRELYIEHVVDGLLRGDTASRFSAYAVGRQWGWLTVNNILAMENMEPAGPAGDVYLQPMNMVDANNPAPAAGAAAKGRGVTVHVDSEGSAGGGVRGLDEMAAAGAEAKRVLGDVMLDAARRVCRRVANDLQQLGGKALRDGRADDMQVWVAGFVLEQRRFVAETLQPVRNSWVLMMGGAGWDSRSSTVIDEFLGDLAQQFGALAAGGAAADEALGLLVRYVRDYPGSLVARMEAELDDWCWALTRRM